MHRSIRTVWIRTRRFGSYQHQHDQGLLWRPLLPVALVTVAVAAVQFKQRGADKKGDEDKKIPLTMWNDLLLQYTTGSSYNKNNSHSPAPPFNLLLRWSPTAHKISGTTYCDDGNEGNNTNSNSLGDMTTEPAIYDDEEEFVGTEPERFSQCLEYHRHMLPEYIRLWGNVNEYDDQQYSGTSSYSTMLQPSRGSSDDTSSSSNNKTQRKQQQLSDIMIWPPHVVSPHDVSALEYDLQFCQRSGPKCQKECQNRQFQIAAHYLIHHNQHNQQQGNKQSSSLQRKGYKAIKQLAEQGHADGMCLYGIVLNEGWVEGVDVNPKAAVFWWRQCVDEFGHIHATYELAVAYYTGDGTVENTAEAVRLFARAAHLGHAGAAYMLGECLLDGVGIPRDRAKALEWLTTAAELGHDRARYRVFVILQQDYDTLESGLVKLRQEQPLLLQHQVNHETTDNISNTTEASEEIPKWVSEDLERIVNIERRFTIGGGSRNPHIFKRRKSKVEESREKVSS